MANLKPRLIVVLLPLLLVLLVAGCSLLFKPPGATSVHLLLGNPSQATADVTNDENYLMLKPQYALSYNNRTRIPNWVSWQLNASWLGNVPRSNQFRPDDSLPVDWYRVTPGDYTGSGYDRGHLTPAADRSATPTDNAATFLMTNIFPQTPDNNRGPWEELESYCRELVRDGRELYIVAGGYGKRKAIGKGKVTVPTHTWKVIVVLEQANLGLGSINAQTRTIAVSIPNVKGIQETDWRTYRVSIDEIEKATGYDLLSNIPGGLQQELESRVDRG